MSLSKDKYFARSLTSGQRPPPPRRRPGSEDLPGTMAWLIVLYLVLRFADLLFQGAPIFTSGLHSFMFILENLFYLVPVLLIVSPRCAGPPLALSGGRLHASGGRPLSLQCLSHRL